MCDVFEPEFLISWPFAFTHFSTIVATFCGLWQIWMRPHASQIGFLHSPAIVQISWSPSYTKCGLLLSSFMECYLAMSYLTYFIFSKKICLCKNKLPILFALWKLFYVLLPVFCKFLEPNRHFTWKMGYDLNDGFVGLN